ncbi:HAD-IIB family hydrolase [Marinimicrobium alkaliphilum]|uniref:HAD-IIB family hydrolase n=1 Tax=Marinimicrobium alkaliphilum TaxID=2202654 RepID=UPI000DB9AAFC|nr:HAD-IIB family hydrolase [Marinimicrobium alkaliphilum]
MTYDPYLVFTDLDGTLLNHHDYDWRPAQPALTRLREREIPVILVSSKTAPEMLELRAELDNAAPFVCENGSVIVIPEAMQAILQLDITSGPAAGYYYSYRGASRERILTVLAPLKKQFAFTGFAEMSVEDIVARTGLSEEAATRAGKRMASEPLLWRDDDAALEAFTEQLAQQRLRLIKGGRFYHVMGQCDKGDAVRSLQQAYQHQFRAIPKAIALGDSPNDLDMLKQADIAVVIPRHNGAVMQDDALRDAIVAPEPGAAGWRQAIEAILAGLPTSTNKP